MALVKFYRGKQTKYSSSTYKDGVYFATDTRTIWMNGVAYTGVDLSDFDGFVKDLTLSSDSTTLSYKKYDKATSKWTNCTVNLLQVRAADKSVVLTKSTTDGVTEIKVNVMPLTNTDDDGLKLNTENGLYVDFTKHDASIKKNTDDIAVLNGTVTTEGSVKKTVKDAIDKLDYTDAAEANHVVTSVSETDGIINVTRGELTSTDKTVVISTNASGDIDLKVNVDGTSIVVDKEKGTLSVADSALIPYVGANAINVSPVSDNKKTISLTINENDKVLSQDTNGLLASLSMSYDKDNKVINLFGKDSTTAISTIDVTDFIKDGMLAGTDVFMATKTSEEITVDGQTNTFDGLTVGHHYIVFLFKIDGKEVKYSWDILDATNIIDVYQAGNGLALSTDGHTFSVKKDTESTDSEKFLSVSDKGVKISGVQDAIDEAAKKAKTVVELGANEKHLILTNATDATDGHVTYTIASTDVASATDLENEIKARKTVDGISGDTYIANTDAHYINDATSLNNADVQLDAAVNVLEEALTWIDVPDDATE